MTKAFLRPKLSENKNGENFEMRKYVVLTKNIKKTVPVYKKKSVKIFSRIIKRFTGCKIFRKHGTFLEKLNRLTEVVSRRKRVLDV